MSNIDELKVYPLMLHESVMKKLEEKACKENKKVESFIEALVNTISTIDLSTIKSTKDEKILSAYAKKLRPVLQAQLVALTETLRKLDLATTDDNNHGQYSDLGQQIVDFRVNELNENIDSNWQGT